MKFAMETERARRSPHKYAQYVILINSKGCNSEKIFSLFF